MPPTMTYCVVPSDTELEVVAALREQYASDPWMSVVVDDRANEEEPSTEVLMQRRPVLRSQVPGSTIPGARFEQHMPPVDVSLADLPQPEVIARATRHDPAASTELRWRCYAQVLVQLTARLNSRTEAHKLVPRVMDALQDALPTYTPDSDFSRWLRKFIADMPLDDAHR
jgi:hypothetical protein